MAIRPKTSVRRGVSEADRVIGLFLMFLRHVNRRSQKQFGAELGLTEDQVSAIESGRTPLKLKAAWKACCWMDIHPDFLISNGKWNPGPFSIIEWEDRQRIEKLINAHANANFIDAWPAVRSVVLEAGAQGPEATNKVMLDKLAPLTDDPGVKKKIRSLPELLESLRELTKDRGCKIALAKEMHVTRQAVDQWLSGATAPTAETTFELLQWVEQQERQK